LILLNIKEDLLARPIIHLELYVNKILDFSDYAVLQAHQ